MGFAHFFYGDGWDAAEAADAAEDALIKACVTLEHECDGSDAAKSILSGYRRVWVGCQEAADEEGDFDPGYFETVADAEQCYRRLYLKAYVRTIRRSYPKYETDGDGLGWWPEALPYDSAWPRKLLAKLATVMGEIEGERSVAMARHFEQKDAEQQASATD
jgi:hypothetical protein